MERETAHGKFVRETEEVKSLEVRRHEDELGKVS